jgi:hypothetical protein
MCNHCYHKYGRNSNATDCPHPDRLVYAKGKCQNCYLNDYNKKKRRMKRQTNEDEIIMTAAGSNSSLEPLPKRARI